ncbi:hypothetical protein P0136_08700 [Lentisphaerota bacterium ZTH]|nr:hypothetical protein JYG24_00195 [Lentisphaerota bacterium]WET05442.1 hypothetical protein P0136_08700 [Lentisphaerota bacterium ZTH]
MNTFSVCAQTKRHYVWDATSLSEPLNDMFITPQWALWPAWDLSVPNSCHKLLGEVPAIGYYEEESYKFRQKLLIVNMNENALELLPRNMRQAIIPGIKQFDNMGEVVLKNNLRCFVCAVITGKGSHADDETMVGKEFNISFHGFVSRHFEEGEENFAYYVPAGMFVPKGILAASEGTIPMERCETFYLSCQQKWDKKRKFFSSSSSHFVPVSEISSFWTFAKMGKKGEDIMVTYHLLFNTARVANAAKTLVHKDDFWEMLESIRSLADDLSLDELSSGILRDWVDNVAHVSNPFGNEVLESAEKKELTHNKNVYDAINIAVTKEYDRLAARTEEADCVDKARKIDEARSEFESSSEAMEQTDGKQKSLLLLRKLYPILKDHRSWIFRFGRATAWKNVRKVAILYDIKPEDITSPQE